MNELFTAASAVREFSLRPVTGFAALPLSEQVMFADPATRDLLRRSGTASPAERDQAVRVLAPTIAEAHPFWAGRTAILCGTMVEHGADPSPVADALLARMPSFLPLAVRGDVLLTSVGEEQARNHPEKLFQQDSEVLGARWALRFYLLAVMTTFCRLPAARQRARQIPGLEEQLTLLAENSPEADYVLQVLALTDGMELLVLHPEQGKGFRVRLEAVNFNFHLFTLLQDAVTRGAKGTITDVEPVDSEVAAIAKGEVVPTRMMHDSARFQFHDYRALKSDGTLDRADTGAWLWGEGRPGDIPVFEGERIVLLGKPVLASRSWDINFFAAGIHDALRPQAEVTMTLNKGTVAAYLERLQNRPRE